MSDVKFGPTGEVVYQRTYSRTKPDGSKETWPETVARVVRGNMALVYGDNLVAWPTEVKKEASDLMYYMERFAILPAGRHLWASGVKGRQYLFNCHVAGWVPGVMSQHFEFSFLRLMEGGGVGSNYSTKYLSDYGPPRRTLKVHIVSDPEHKDIEELRPLLSDEYHPDWEGAFVVEDSREGWAAALVDLIDTFMTDVPVQHLNRVYDVSNVRPSGSRLKTFGGTASGPAPFARMMLEVASVLNDARQQYRITPLHAMEIDHAIAECVVSGGNRRSARMSIVHWDDPSIFDFIECKKDTGKHWTTNISVEIDGDFFEALTVVGSRARAVHETVVTAMLENGEPGYWNSTLSQEGEVGSVIATNPCLTGDTVIATVDGPRTFADLAESGEDVLVYSWHPKTKTPVIRWMRHPHRTAKDAEILKVTFDSGLVVRCTPNHGFYSFRGKKIEARDLVPGQSIRAFSASRDSSGHERAHGWDSARNAANHQWTHRMLWENFLGAPLPEGVNVAHLDGDGTNNSMDNLALMTELGHRRYDMPARQAAGMSGHSPNHKVVSVEPAGREDVYNGMVEDSHAYIILDHEPIAGHMSGIVSANCGEIALQPWENCNLGHVNLDYFAPGRKGDGIDMDGLREAHRLVARFLIRATYGDVNDPKQAVALARNRRIGVGHLGVQGFWAKLGVRYSEIPTAFGSRKLLRDLYNLVRQEARDYAFQLRIPEPVKVTTVAPTGTVAKLAGVAEGIHPIYARWFERRVRFSKRDPEQRAQIEKFEGQGFRVEEDVYDKSGQTAVVVFPTKDPLVVQVKAMGWPDDAVESADQVSVEDMLRVQRHYQAHWADNAVSYTVNVPEGKVTAGELAGLLEKYLPSLKGTTLMVDASRPQAPYTRITKAEYDSAMAKTVEDSIDEECAQGACPVR
jgi:ribonucleotide reductase alpha subunit